MNAQDPISTPENRSVSSRGSRFPMFGLIGLGFITDFFDALGVGSFATTTTTLRMGRIVEDDDIPGTLNVGHAIPSLLEAILFLVTVPVNMVLLCTMVPAGGLGAWLGTGFVVRWPKPTIQRAMAISLLITAILISLRQCNVFQSDEAATSLGGLFLFIAIAANFMIGSLTSLGIGNYAPTMAVLYLLGLNPKAFFPIMAASAALILPTAAIRFWKSGRFDRRTAWGLTLGGVPGVLIAVYMVKEMPVYWLLWMVVVVLIYSSLSLYQSSLRREKNQDA